MTEEKKVHQLARSSGTQSQYTCSYFLVVRLEPLILALIGGLPSVLRVAAREIYDKRVTQLARQTITHNECICSLRLPG